MFSSRHWWQILTKIIDSVTQRMVDGKDDIAEGIDDMVNNYSVLWLICVFVLCVKEEKELDSELGDTPYVHEESM